MLKAIDLISLCSILFILTCLSSCGTTNRISENDSVTLKPCWFETEDSWPQSECGVLTVPENYDNPSGRQVRLPFIIYKADKPNTSRYPLVIAGGGGPGNPLSISEPDTRSLNTELWSPWYAATLKSGRDLILIDNRGVGSSKPRLACTEVEQADIDSLDKRYSTEEVISITRKAFTACKHRLTEQGVDISQYHVINAARDLEALRLGLGYKQLNLYGISYGSRVSLVYERMFPDSVRSLILDGIYPQASPSLIDLPRLNYESVIRVINKCQADQSCNDRFAKNLEDRFKAYLKKIDRKPLNIRITSPINYKPIDVLVTPDVFFDSIYTMLYDHYAIELLPKYLYSIFNGNIDYLAEIIRDYYVRDIMIDPLDVGAYASYACFDDYPFTNFKATKAEIKSYPLQHYSNRLVAVLLKTMCESWDVPAVSADFKSPYHITTPVLIYSGELDPITPAKLASPVIEHADTVWETVWPNLSHGVMLFSDCADWTAATFLENPSRDPFIYDCVNAKNPLDFDTDNYQRLETYLFQLFSPPCNNRTFSKPSIFSSN